MFFTTDYTLYLARIWGPTATHALCFILGAALARLIKHAVRLISRRRDVGDRDGTDSALYSLEHGKLNIALPPPTMWMNMGYWEKTSDFPTACRALLSEVLSTAKLLTPGQREPVASSPHRRALKFIDLGFGCGDQTIYLLREVFNASPAPAPPPKPSTETDKQHLLAPAPLGVASYVGITLDRTQYRFTRNRLASQGLLSRDDSDADMDTSASGKPHVQIICADAAAPTTWSAEVTSDVHLKSVPVPSSSPPNTPLTSTSALETRAVSGVEDLETWVLALDTLYHFRPTRAPILQHTYHSLHASFLAFDLLLSSRTTLPQRLVLRLICLLSGTPFSNFITESSYRTLLMRAGYPEQNIIVRDVSEHVFAPLAKFLKEREGQLTKIGLAIGGFRFAGWMFGWWGESRVVRGVIIVARR